MRVDDREIDELKRFVTNVYVWLSWCYGVGLEKREPVWPVITVKEELRELARRAWIEFAKTYPWDGDSPSSLIEPISRHRSEVLVAHGLYGEQLNFKLQVIELAARKVRSRTRGVSSWRKRLIDAIDVVVDSLGPTGLAGGLKELKDILAVAMVEK
jgi:hypothetical protein